jgi:hypothetical protein
MLTFALILLGLFTQVEDSHFPRLNSQVFEVVPPSSRVQGSPGSMTVRQSGCKTMATEESRRRIVNVAVQEWAFFGFQVVEPDEDESDNSSIPQFQDPARVAASIAGYWTATAAGSGIVSQQNRAWNDRGIDTRWVAPWSAAFISWVMCESGLGTAGQFQRAIAHHVYIDQAIRARDGAEARAAFAAYDIGEAAIEPGDLLCSSRRPVYRNLAGRRRQMGEGARTHCDVVVKVDETGQRIFVVGGNVRRSVSMKLFPAGREAGKHLRPLERPMLGRIRPLFAHLKLRAKPIESNAFDNSPTMKAMTCAKGPLLRAGLAGPRTAQSC